MTYPYDPKSLNVRVDNVVTTTISVTSRSVQWENDCRWRLTSRFDPIIGWAARRTGRVWFWYLNAQGKRRLWFGRVA